MPAEEAFRQIQRELAGNPAVNVVLGSRPAGAAEDDLQRLAIGNQLQAEFQEIGRDAVQVQDVHLVPYEAGYKLEENDVLWIDLDAAPNITNTINQIFDFQNLPIFRHAEDNGFISHLQYYAMFARVSPRRRVALLRKTSSKIELSRGSKVVAMFQNGHYDKMQETVFLFDRRVDAWSDGRYVFIRNITNFEKIFRYFERLQERAQATVTTVLARIPIANAEAFEQACTTQVRFMTKLAVIASKPYLADLRIDDLRANIEAHQLDIEIVWEDGVEKLVFDPDPSRRWILLKLLDDDYLDSRMTNMTYEVNSKISRGRVR